MTDDGDDKIDEHVSDMEEEVINESDSSESMNDDDDDGDGDGDGDDGNENDETKEKKTFIPTADTLDEELDYDETAYIMYHKAETGFPCLSFDIIKDNLGDGANRADRYPQTCHLIAGTQATKVHMNHLLVLKMSNLNKIETKEDDGGESSDSEEDLDRKPELEYAQIPHKGCVNRVRTTIINNKAIAASWSELGNVHIWDLSQPLQAVNDYQAMTLYVNNYKDKIEPIFSFTGHRTEGFAIDWSNVKPGLLATGDCSKNIFIWNPTHPGDWYVNQQPLVGHTDSVEDLQWSPNEENVLASCSVDKSIRIWDIRAKPKSNCMITVNDAHESDVNVISWNRLEKAFLISGGDDGVIKTWDLRQFKGQNPKPIATFKHHLSYITSLEWNPSDSTVFAASGNDNQLTIWDLAVEKDEEKQDEEKQVKDLPPQLLFIHQGQKEIKELHWHPQISGVIVSTALNGFDIFRTISV